jgi:hypothetical protein
MEVPMSSSSFHCEVFLSRTKDVESHLDRVSSKYEEAPYMGLRFEGTGEGSKTKIPSIMTPFPPALLPFVIRVVIKDEFPDHIHRTVGAYTLRTANAELLQTSTIADYGLHLEATKYEDAVELYKGILARKIAPSESWE